MRKVLCLLLLLAGVFVLGRFSYLLRWNTGAKGVPERKQPTGQTGGRSSAGQPIDVAANGLGLSSESVGNLTQRERLTSMNLKELEDEYRRTRQEPNGALKARELRTIFEFIARKDPQRAVTLALEVRGNERANDLAGAMAGWVTLDPEAPWRWLSQNMNLVTTGQAAELCDTIASAALDTEGASLAFVGQVMTLAPAPFRGRVIYAAIQRVAGNDPDTAQGLLSAIDDPEIRKFALANIAKARAKFSPQDAANWALNLPHDDMVAALPTVVSEWALSYPGVDPDFLGWLKKLPAGTDSETLDLALSRFASVISYRDPESGLAVINEIEDPSRRDQRLARMAAMFCGRDPIVSLQYAHSISDTSQRLDALTAAYRVLVKKDPMLGMAAFRADQAISEDDRSIIESRLRK